MPRPEPVATPKKVRPRWWRWLRRGLFALAVLVVLAVGGVFLLLHNLDSGVIKHRLQKLARESAGLELDYATAKVELLHGLTLGDVTVASPQPYRDVAPHLLRAGGVTLGWSFFGKGPTLRKITARDVEVNLVVDDSGHSSLEAIGGQEKKEPAPPRAPVPPGKQLADTLATLPEFDHLTLAHLAVNVVRTHGATIVGRGRLEGLGGKLYSIGDGDERHIQLDIGHEEEHLPIALALQDGDGPRREAAGKAWIHVALDGKGAELRVRLSLDRHDLPVGLPASGDLITLDAKARSDGDRLVVSLDKLELIAKAVDAKGRVTLAPDRILVDDTAGEADLTRLVALVPESVAKLALKQGHLRWSLDGVELSALPGLGEHGKVELDGKLAQLRAERGPSRAELDKLDWKIDLQGAADGGVTLKVELPVEKLRLWQAPARAELAALKVTVDAALPRATPGHARVEIRAGAAEAVGSKGTVRAGEAELTLHVTDLRLDPAHLVRSSATVAFASRVASVDGKLGPRSARADDLALSLHAKVEDGAPKTLELEAPIGKLQIAGVRGLALPPGPVRVALRVAPEHYDPARPIAATGSGHVELAAAGITLGADVKKHPDDADFDVKLDAPKAGMLTSLAPASLGLPAKLGLGLTASGRIEALAETPRLRGKLHARVDHAGMNVADSLVAADTLELDLDGNGNARSFDVNLGVAPTALSLDDDSLGSGHFALQLAYQASGPSIDLHFSGAATNLPNGRLALQAKWERSQRALVYAVDGEIGHLAALGPLLPESFTDEHWFDLSDLGVKIAGKGTLAGALTDVDAHGVPKIAPDPIAKLRGDGSLEVALSQVHYRDAAGVELTVPQVTLVTAVRSDGKTHRARTHVAIPDAKLLARGHKIVVAQLRDMLDIAVEGDPLTAPITAKHELRVGKLEQDVLPQYPIADTRFDLTGHRTADGTLRLDTLEFDNPSGGTSLRLDGALIVPRTTAPRGGAAVHSDGEGQPLGFSSLASHVVVEQQLDKLSGALKVFRGTGLAKLEAEVASGDLHRFHIASVVKLDNVSLELPSRQLRVARVDGQLPVVEDVLVLGGTSRFLPAKPDPNAYPQLRFADQHSFLSDRGAIRAEKIAFRDLVIDELAGNLTVKRNIISVDQLEARLRGGRVAGQCRVEWKGMDSLVSLRARATGIEARHGGKAERFDGNAALLLAVGKRALDGRIEIVRIGRQHLLDILDDVDPHRSNAGTNRIRTALALGYPDKVRLVFDRGFASLRVGLGGVAEVVKISEVRGIPTGPLVERYLGPVLSEKAP